MPIINTVVNEATDEEITFAKGTVKRILFKDSSPAQKKYDTMKIASIIVESPGEDDVFVNMNLKKDEERVPYVEGKKGEEVWFELQQGDEVKLTCKVSEYQGKPRYETSLQRIKVTKRADKVSGSAGKSVVSKQEKSEPYDSTGQLVGHAVLGGAALLASGVKGDLLSLSKLYYSATSKAKEQLASQTGQNVNGKNFGMSVGNAINGAVKLVEGNEKDIEEFLVSKAIEIFNEVTTPLKEWIKEGAPEEKVKDVKPKNSTKNNEPGEKSPEPSMDFDQDIPFAPVGLQHSRHAIYALFA